MKELLRKGAFAAAIVFISVVCFALTACGGGAETGTYYRYVKGEYRKSEYYVLESGKKWSNPKGIPTNGTYTISGDNIIFYCNFLGAESMYAEGKIEDGVIYFSGGDVYCKEGAIPAESDGPIILPHLS